MENTPNKNEEVYVILQFRGNWADEFDVYGIEGMSFASWFDIKRETWENWPVGKPVSFYWSGNYKIVFESYANWIQSFKVHFVTKTEFDTIRDAISPHTPHSPRFHFGYSASDINSYF